MHLFNVYAAIVRTFAFADPFASDPICSISYDDDIYTVTTCNDVYVADVYSDDDMILIFMSSRASITVTFP